ncbi:ABC transporter permease [Alistipes timonensis]|uniref:ABC transporter permease n=1 Tax=Alistipes timonensis TaxID=1465754 RepID=UPI001C3DDB6F|nr:ABC transporter permease [Alistipes timonensis]MCR2031196.1 ABC transporter permease [Alistipes timonensis]
MRLLWKLLRCHLSMAQLVGFSLAGLVGMTVVLGALQAYRDIRPIVDRPDSFLRGDYLVLSKRVNALNTLGLGSSDFTPGELDDLRAQPFVREVGALTPADYRITGSVGMGGVNLSTYLFFESVPDRFLDVEAADWNYEPGSRDIPIIIPRNYVNLYNYGFAPSQGLPQISEGIFRRVSLGIDIAGNGRSEQFRGRIVGLSNRLNTILVPDAFIRWSNERFGTRTGERHPARVIVETDRPVDAAVSEYLARKGYEAEGDRRDDGKATRFLQLAASGVAGVGLAFSGMSFYILLLSIFLLLQKNSDKLENLLLLGYAPARVARPYRLLTFGLNFGVLAAALLAVWLLRLAYLPSLTALQEGYQPAGMGVTLLCGTGLALLLSLLDGMAIRRKVGALGRGNR